MNILKKFIKGSTLIELMVVMGIIGFLTTGIVAFLISTDRSWRIGQTQMSEQQEARRAIDDISSILRRAQTNSTYQVQISDANRRIDFYIPIFYPDCCPKCGTDTTCSAECVDSAGNCHSRGEVRSLSKITYKLNPSRATQILKKEGTNPEAVIANNITALNFNCGCLNCVAVNITCPRVDVSVTSQISIPYQLTSKIALRNINMTLPDALPVEQPAEGEF